MTDKRVPFVEDSPTMRRIIANSLKQMGFEKIMEAENGVDAMEKLEGNEVDLILTDWNMPEMNGEEFVTELRKLDIYKEIPILMITTRGMKDDVMAILKLVVNGYIVKPFTPELLQKKINDIVL